MKKLERMDGKLFETLVNSQLSDLSQITGAEKVNTGNLGNGIYSDCNFTSSMKQGSTVSQIIADSSNYTDDCSLTQLPNGANAPLFNQHNYVIRDYEDGLFNQWIL